MSTETEKETRGFQTEVQQLLDLMIHSLYSHRDIFLRELISNASDAADKLRFEALKDESLLEDAPDLKIRVEYNKEQKTISVIDNGIGMTREEVIENLGTIAKSGTKQFFQQLTGDQGKDSQLIGQFGVGFYSSFIVAGRIEVVTRKAGLGRNDGVRWVSEGKEDYTIETVQRPKRGTKVTLYLTDEAKEFLGGQRLRSIIKHYSDHISLPIVMPEEGEDKTGEEVVNKATALWTRGKNDILDEEYKEFYKHVAHDFDDPMAWTHNKVEGKNEYISLLYIPNHAPFDLGDREHQHGIKLYVRRVFIMDDADQLLPPYLRFVRGIVDSDDLPLNVSREILQKNKTIDTIRSACARKVLDLLLTMAEKEPEKYARFWQQFGRVLKEGVIDDVERREELARLFRFASTHDESEQQNVSLEDYLGRMKEGQEFVYYITAENLVTARNSPHLEIFRERGIEVLLLTDPIDEWLTTQLTEFDGNSLKSISKGDLDPEELGQAAESDTEAEDGEQDDYQDLVKRIQAIIDDKVKEVRVTRRLTTSPACLVADQHEMSRHLEELLRASGQNVPVTRPILEINPRHPVVNRLAREQDQDRFKDWSHILFDQALLSEGGKLEDPAGFVHRLNNLILELDHTRADP